MGTDAAADSVERSVVPHDLQRLERARKELRRQGDQDLLAFRFGRGLVQLCEQLWSEGQERRGVARELSAAPRAEHQTAVSTAGGPPKQGPRSDIFGELGRNIVELLSLVGASRDRDNQQHHNQEPWKRPLAAVRRGIPVLADSSAVADKPLAAGLIQLHRQLYKPSACRLFARPGVDIR